MARTGARLAFTVSGSIVAIVCLSLFQEPYLYGVGNHVFQVPKVYEAINPDYFPGDPLVETLSNYPSSVYSAVASLVRLTGSQLEAVYLALHVLMRLWTVGALYAIISSLMREQRGAAAVTLVVAAGGWFTRGTIVGGDALLHSYFTHTTVAFALGVTGLALWLRKRKVLAAVFVGLAAWANMLLAGHLLACLLLSWAFDPDRFDRSYLHSLLALLLVLSGAMSSVISAFMRAQPSEEQQEMFWFLAEQVQGPHHYFTPTKLLGLVVLTALAVWVYRSRALSAPARRFLGAAAVWLWVMCLLDYLGVYVLKSQTLYFLHGLRADKWLIIIVIPGVAAIAWSKLRDSGSSMIARVLGVLMIVLLLAGLRSPVVTTIGVLLIAVALQTHSTGLGEWQRRVGYTLAALAFLGGLVAAALSDNHTMLSLQIAAAGLVGGVAATRGGQTRQIAAIALVVLLAGAQAFHASYSISQQKPTWYRVGYSDDFTSTARWAATNTTASSTFITPPHTQGWRCLSRRSTYVQYRDGNAMDWAPWYVLVYWERMTALDCDVLPSAHDYHQQLADRYSSLTPVHLLGVALENEIDYIVTTDDWAPGQGMVPVYANQGFRVFSVDALRLQTEGDRD